MSDDVELTLAGVRIGAEQAIVGTCDQFITLTVTDAAGGGTITMPIYAFEHLAERAALKIAELERAARYPGDAEPLVPRHTGSPAIESPWG